eukprot:3526746-Rhodomonas_salina.1
MPRRKTNGHPRREQEEEQAEDQEERVRKKGGGNPKNKERKKKPPYAHTHPDPLAPYPTPHTGLGYVDMQRLVLA